MGCCSHSLNGFLPQRSLTRMRTAQTNLRTRASSHRGAMTLVRRRSSAQARRAGGRPYILLGPCRHLAMVQAGCHVAQGPAMLPGRSAATAPAAVGNGAALPRYWARRACPPPRCAGRPGLRRSLLGHLVQLMTPTPSTQGARPDTGARFAADQGPRPGGGLPAYGVRACRGRGVPRGPSPSSRSARSPGCASPCVRRHTCPRHPARPGLLPQRRQGAETVARPRDATSSPRRARRWHASYACVKRSVMARMARLARTHWPRACSRALARSRGDSPPASLSTMSVVRPSLGRLRAAHHVERSGARSPRPWGPWSRSTPSAVLTAPSSDPWRSPPPGARRSYRRRPRVAAGSGSRASGSTRKDVSTTMIYTHVLQRGGRGVRSPLDPR